MTEIISREIRLKRRPVGLPKESDFEIVGTVIPNPEEGQVIMRNIYMSVDPYMRGRMYDRKSYMPPFQVGEALDGGCVGQVVASRNEAFQEGDYVRGRHGWREYHLSDGRDLMKIDPSKTPIQAYLGVLGVTGLTAYTGLLDIGQPKEGETVFVSAASGAVGAVACQIARIKGCRVVGSAGSDEKVAWLKDVAGIDAAFNYKEADDLADELGKHCPDGVDIYFENVGGEFLEAALHHMNDFGRVVACGMISQYNLGTHLPGPRNLYHIVIRRLTIQGFVISDHFDRFGEFYANIGPWIAQGKIKWHETVIEGIENAPKALIGLFKGENLGKMLVKI